MAVAKVSTAVLLLLVAVASFDFSGLSYGSCSWEYGLKAVEAQRRCKEEPIAVAWLERRVRVRVQEKAPPLSPPSSDEKAIPYSWKASENADYASCEISNAGSCSCTSCPRRTPSPFS